MGRDEWDVVDMRDEDRIDVAFESCEDICAKVLKMSAESQVHRVSTLTLTGQIKYLYRIKAFVSPMPNSMVNSQAPMKPSTVFFGLILMS